MQAAEALAGNDGDEDEEAELTLCLAVCVSQLQGAEAALPLYRRAAGLGASAGRWAALAHALFRVDESDEAEEIFTAVLAEKPDVVAIMALYADGLLTAHARHEDVSRLERARALLERSLVLAPDEAELHFSLCRYHLLRHDWTPAEEAVLAGLALDPESPRGLKYLSAVRLGRKAPVDETVDALRSAIQADPSDGAVAKSLELSLFRQELAQIHKLEVAAKPYRPYSQLAEFLWVGGLGTGVAGIFIQLVSFVIDDQPAHGEGLVMALAGFATAAVGGVARVAIARRILEDSGLASEDGGADGTARVGPRSRLVAGAAGVVLGALIALGLYGVRDVGRTGGGTTDGPAPPATASQATEPDEEPTGLVPSHAFGEAAVILQDPAFSETGEATELFTVVVESVEPATPAEIAEWQSVAVDGVGYYTLRYTVEPSGDGLSLPATGISLVRASIRLLDRTGFDNPRVEEVALVDAGQTSCVPIRIDPIDGGLSGCELWRVPDGVEVVAAYGSSSLLSDEPFAVWGRP